jgi:cbb3-type cytochrome oxidase subunit 3
MSTPASATSGTDISQHSARALSRYEKGYRVAKAVIGLGQLCKAVGVFVGIVVIFFAVLGSQTVMRPNPSLVGVVNYQAQGNLYLISAIFFGLVIAFIGWVIGVLVGAYGHHLKAALDEAANTSPFLSDAQRIQLMKFS